MEKIKQMSPTVAKVISQKYTKKVLRVELSWTMSSRANQAKQLDPVLRMPGLFHIDVDASGAHATVLFVRVTFWVS